MHDTMHDSPPVRLILAPLLGITTSVFRHTLARHTSGLSQALAPFIVASRSTADFEKLTRDLKPRNNPASLPLIPQIVGNDGKAFAETANQLAFTFGFEEVNWNIGCAAGTTPSRLRGAGLLPHPELIDRFLDEAFALFRGRVSIKMRLGMTSARECMALLPVLNRFPIHEICVHPRTGLDRFSGPLDLGTFSEFCAGLRAPVVFNGDVTTAAAAREILGRFRFLAGLMLGRGVIANPWLAQAIQCGGCEADLLTAPLLRRFHDDLFLLYQRTMEGGAGPVLARMREVWSYWEAHWQGRERLIRTIVKARTLEAYESAVENAFAALMP